MLVLSRRAGESIQIGDNITITVVKTGPNVRIGIDAPKDIVVLRKELADAHSHLVDRSGVQCHLLSVLSGSHSRVDLDGHQDDVRGLIAGENSPL